jgi:RNA polymerase sigma-70 factor, ECF subfamily
LTPDYSNDRDLVAALTVKDESAYRYVIRHYQPSMLYLARSITGDGIADEVVQEAWFSVMKSLAGFEYRSSLKSWILRIVANEAKTRRRRENREVSLEELAKGDPEFADRFDAGGHWARGREPSSWRAAAPDELLATEELRDCLEQVLASMPPMQSATLRLREYENYRLEEICNILDVSESNVRVLLHRARQRMFTAIEHFQETGECCTE